MKCKITIIIAVYNCVNYLEQCLLSIVNQNKLDHIELIIVDGGSTDGTLLILDKYSDYIDYWISENDDGISSAWNKGVRKATGEWIYFLGADDYLSDSDVIGRIVNKLEVFPCDVKLAYGNINLVTESDLLLYTVGDAWPEAKKNIFTIMTIPHQGLFHRAALFADFGLFSTDYKIAADYDFVLRVIKNKFEPIYLDNITVANMRRGGISTQKNYSLTTLLEFARIRYIHTNRLPNHKWYLIYLREYFRVVLRAFLGDKILGHILNVKLKLQNKPTIWNK